MLSDKEQKKEFRKIASKNPENYYAVKYLKKEGFERKQCKCGTYFWTVNAEQKVCGDSTCSGGFRFIGNSPCKKKLSYIEVWKEFSNMFKKFGYTSLDRYPLVARWNPTMEYTIASIAAFQPFVISGEVKPPAKKLVIPQFCLRFVDIDNVGITGAHNTGFVMIGQHQFVSKNEWDQNKVLSEIHNWLKEGLGLPDEELTFHEDAWAGGGNFGPCMEFFSRGVEIGNQVYMMYEQTPNSSRELPIKVLEMCMGQERCAWISQGCATIYDATFPKVMKHLYEASGLKTDEKLMAKFIPYAGYLNVDEVEDLEKAWEDVAKKVGMKVHDLKNKILPLSQLYSIGEHSRSLLVVFNDGGLPSNIGGAYNLRILVRRCFYFIEKNNWNIDLFEVCKGHAKELKQQYPELSKNLDSVKKILNVEKSKYDANKQKSKTMVDKLVKNKLNISTDKLIELYDSSGINPEIVKAELQKCGIYVHVPDNFYALVAQRHEHKIQEHQTNKAGIMPNLDLVGLPETKALYYEDYKLVKFKAKILRILWNYVILDKTAFYPTSGGQLHDVGTINGFEVSEVFKDGKIIIHKLKNHNFKEGDQSTEVKCEIDKSHRIQLAQHHTSTHIINAAARRVLGNHINQAGAKKTFEKAHIDLTHYQSVSEDELKAIESEANKIIKQSIPVKKMFLDRDAAEKKYGLMIYQGGVPIGQKLRIVDIIGVDVEACGGTHLDNTKEAQHIKILKCSKISDSIVRIEFVAGNRAAEQEEREHKIIITLAKLLDCKESQIPSRAEELFSLWKEIVKKGRKFENKELKSKIDYPGNVIAKTSEILKTQPEYLVKTVERFLKELN